MGENGCSLAVLVIDLVHRKDAKTAEVWVSCFPLRGREARTTSALRAIKAACMVSTFHVVYINSACGGVSKTLKLCHSALDAESSKQGTLTKLVPLSPDAHPLDSRFHGNDVRGYL